MLFLELSLGLLERLLALFLLLFGQLTPPFLAFFLELFLFLFSLDSILFFFPLLV